MVYLVSSFRTASPDTAFEVTLRELLQEGKGWSEVIQKSELRAGSLNIKILLLIKENQKSQEIQHFSMYEKMPESGLAESFLSYTSQLSGTTVRPFPHHPPAPQGSPGGVAGSCRIAGIVLHGHPLSSEIHICTAGITYNCDISLVI